MRTVTKVSKDLADIIRLSGALEDQAVALADDPLMPGGLAMVCLGPVANQEAWVNTYEAREHLGLPHDHIADEEPDSEWEPPEQTLRFWSEAWRAEHGCEYDTHDRNGRREWVITAATEAAFIRSILHWVWQHEPHWDDFAEDVRLARVRLENVLHAGDRSDRTRVTCDREGCTRRPQLIRVYGDTEAADAWKCPACKAWYSEDDRTRALGRQLRSEGAERFVQAQDARSVLATVGRARRTVRKWTGPQHHHWCSRCKKRFRLGDETCTYCGGPLRLRGDSEAVVLGYCDLATHTTWLWWPDLWRLHLTTPERRRTTARRSYAGVV